MFNLSMLNINIGQIVSALLQEFSNNSAAHTVRSNKSLNIFVDKILFFLYNSKVNNTY